MLSKTLVVFAAFCLTGTYEQGLIDHGHEHGGVGLGGDPLGVRPLVPGPGAYGSPLDHRPLPGGPLVPHREPHGPLDVLGGPRSGRLGGLNRQEQRRLRKNDRRLQKNIRRTMRRQRKNERRMNRISQRQLNRQRRPGRGGRRNNIGYAG